MLAIARMFVFWQDPEVLKTKQIGGAVRRALTLAILVEEDCRVT